ncbi:Uncharacterized protein SCF082_LOCUS23500 [Durusdinium trenchii]|uniref:Exportin-1/Importin-beta-like domain-containing protein n=1 Tax=Durusdinium trenchii TaxID=1381693 RepID=A0ABP0LP66_9DINO
MTGITAPMVQPADLAKQLQQRVTMFHAGDELYSGAWLADFQKSGLTAWHVCTEKLRVGPLKSCDEELLQAFCAQTLARLARTFASHFDPNSQKAARDTLEALLAVHACGQALVWKQLALALACAELWLGTWAAAASLNTTLPGNVRRELLVLPAELLFDSKALPLTDRAARQSVATSLFSSCDGVFAFLLEAQSDAEQCLRILSAWLRAVRKAQLWLPTCDTAQPLRHLAAHLPVLLAAAEAAPVQAAELAQQLAKWKSAPQEAAGILKPLLQQIMKDSTGMEVFQLPDGSSMWLLPLLQDLAEDFWPRSAVGDLDLDCEAISKQAFSLLDVTAAWESGINGLVDKVDVEASISVWHTFADTIHSAIRASESFCSASRSYSPTFSHPEKRSRRSQERWHLTSERLGQAQMVIVLFQLLVQKLLNCMRLPEIPEDEEALESLQLARETVEAALRPWAALLSNADTWMAELWGPLQELEKRLVAMTEQDEGFMSVELARDVEAVIWFFGAFCSCLPEGQTTAAQAASQAVSTLIPQLHQLDSALPPWTALLWSSVCRFGAAVNSKLPAGMEPILLEWMLDRPPANAGAPEMLEVTELPYAKALEVACQRLPDTAANSIIGEKLSMLAFGSWDPSAMIEERTLQAKALYLSALRWTMAFSPEVLCQSLVSKVVPRLSMASSAEVKNAGSTWKAKGAPWPATRLLFDTLTTLLPVNCPADESHASISIWRQALPVFEDVLLRCVVDDASEQPLKGAAEALQRAAIHAPVLLAEVLQLLTRGVQERDFSEVLLVALQEIVVAVPCPPVDPSKAAELLATAIGSATEQVLRQSQATEIPDILAAQYGLLSQAVRPSSPGTAGQGPCEDKLRPILLNQRVLIARCLSLVSLVLPDCLHQAVSTNMLRFATHLMSNEEAEPEAHAAMLKTALPAICAAVCRALAIQDFFAEPEALAEAGKLFLAAASVLPSQLPEALSAGVSQLDLSDHSKMLLEQHVQARAEWSQSQWLEQLQQIVVEWHSERRLTVL